MSVFYCTGCGSHVDADWVSFYHCESCGKEYCETHWGETFCESGTENESDNFCGACIDEAIKAGKACAKCGTEFGNNKHKRNTRKEPCDKCGKVLCEKCWSLNVGCTRTEESYNWCPACIKE